MLLDGKGRLVKLGRGASKQINNLVVVKLRAQLKCQHLR